MRDRLKILDCNRKNILKLPAPALQLWFCYYMNEDDENESYMSLQTIEEQMDMRMSRRSIITWTKWLLDRGWLVDTGKMAADKWIARGETPTPGAYQIHVYRVDDPTSANSAPEENPSNVEDFTSAISAPVQIAPKVYSYGSGSGFASNSSSTRVGSALPNPNVNPQQPPSLEKEGKGKTETNTKGSLGSGASAGKRETGEEKTNPKKNPLAPDGTAWAEWDKHDSAWKAKRLAELRPRECDAIRNGKACKKPGIFDRKKTSKWKRGSDYWHFCLEHKNEYDEREAKKAGTRLRGPGDEALIAEPL